MSGELIDTLTIRYEDEDDTFIVESTQRRGCWAGGKDIAAALGEYGVVLPDFIATFEESL